MKTVVTIARQTGSGGSYLGQQVARRMGWAYVDREILHRTAQILGVEESAVAAADERVPGFWERLLTSFAVGSPEEAYVPPPIRPIPDEKVLEVEAQVMRRLAAEHDCVIVGRGGFHLLRGCARLVNVFVHAPRPFRQKRMCDLFQVTAEEAASLVVQNDRDRERFIRKLVGRSWYDSRNYHVTIDTERAGFEAAEQMVTTLINSTRPSN